MWVTPRTHQTGGLTGRGMVLEKKGGGKDKTHSSMRDGADGGWLKPEGD